jgi:acyl-CoA dehydrogenase
MPWDFSTEPEFEAKLEWMRGFVREYVWPLETLMDELGWEGLRRAAHPLQDQVKEQGLWAAHLDPELGGQGFGQVKLGLMHENSEVLAMAGTQ